MIVTQVSIYVPWPAREEHEGHSILSIVVTFIIIIMMVMVT